MEHVPASPGPSLPDPDEIPVIDVGGPTASVAAEIDLACRNVGFFQVVDHGVDPTVEARAWQLAHQFFALSDDEKLGLSVRDGEAYGYGPFQAERLSASIGVATPPDLKETFSIGPNRAAPVDLADAADTARFAFSPNRWPTSLPELEPVLLRYYDELGDLAARLMGFMAVALGLSRDHFDPLIDEHPSALRLLHYPDVDGHQLRPGQLRAGEHSDYGTLTLLRQDDAPGGLQVRDVDGRWRDVRATPGAYVVNVGDALQRWTNDRWLSSVHRVAVPPIDASGSTARHSMAFFHNANWDVVIECLPTCVDAGARPRHPPVTAGEHLMQKFRYTQPTGGAPS